MAATKLTFKVTFHCNTDDSYLSCWSLSLQVLVVSIRGVWKVSIGNTKMKDFTFLIKDCLFEPYVPQ